MCLCNGMSGGCRGREPGDLVETNLREGRRSGRELRVSEVVREGTLD